MESGSAVAGRGLSNSYKFGQDFYDWGTSAAKGKYSVYMGFDDGIVKYVGMTKRDPLIRFAEHRRSGTLRSGLSFDVFESGLTYREARRLEQVYINKYGLENLYNKINSIAPNKWAQYQITK